MRALALVILVGCGRISFDELHDSGAAGHDEDGDGVTDVDDVCPHLPGPQDDSDGDRVGDACDPNPTVPRDTILLFATMMPGDVPFSTVVNEGDATQLADSLLLTGVAQPDGALSVSLTVPLTVGEVRAAIGFDVLARVQGNQHQVALHFSGNPPYHFSELNEVTSASISHAAITLFDGASFTNAAGMQLADGIHPGRVFLQTTQRPGGPITVDAAWPDESYSARVGQSGYQGASALRIAINNLHLEIRWLVVITSS